MEPLDEIDELVVDQSGYNTRKMFGLLRVRCEHGHRSRATSMYCIAFLNNA